MVTGGKCVPITPLSQVMSRALRLFFPVLDIIYAEQFLQLTGIAIDACPILRTTEDIIKHLEFLNTLGLRGTLDLKDVYVGSFDFANLYPSVCQHDVVNKVNSMIDLVNEISFGFAQWKKFRW